MADLGTDAGQASLNLSVKAMELIQELLKSIFGAEARRNRAEMRLAKKQYKMMKDQDRQAKAIEKIRSKAGLISYKNMKKSGLPFTNTGAQMTANDVKKFAELAKRYNLAFSGLELPGEGQTKLYELIVYDKDIERVNELIKRLNLEKRLDDIEAKINFYEEKGMENLTDEEKEILEGLKAERAYYKDGVAKEFNENMTDTILKEGAVIGEDGKLKGMSLEEALNRLTGYNLSKDNDGFSVIADAKNPGNYIKVHGVNDSFVNEKGKTIDYVRSTYDVYKDNKLVKSFDDRRYVGRPQGYWNQIREEMSSLMGNPKYFYKFNNKDIYKNWAMDVNRQNEQELNSKSIEDFTKELEAKGYRFEDGNVILAYNEVGVDGTIIPEGTVIDKDLMKDVLGKGTSFVSREQMLNLQEAFLIGETIHSLDNLNILAENRDFKFAEIEVAKNNNDANALTSLKEQYDGILRDINGEEENIRQISEQRKAINAAQAEINSSRNKEKGAQNKDFTHDENREERDLKDQQHTMEHWKADINKTKAAKNKMETEAKANTHEHFSGEKYKAPEKVR